MCAEQIDTVSIFPSRALPYLFRVMFSLPSARSELALYSGHGVGGFV